MTSTGFGAATAAAELTPTPGGPARRRRRPAPGSVPRWIILFLAAIYFIGPLVAAVAFTLRTPKGGVSFSAYGDIFKSTQGQVDFSTALVYSLEIALFTIVFTLALMVPTQLLLHLKYRRARAVVEVITLLPLVFPPVVLVVGVSDTFTWIGESKGSALYTAVTWIREANHPLILAFLYVMLAMPFVYRTIDAGIGAIDTGTLVEAARNLGAGWLTVLFRVVLPCMRTALINSAFLCFALVMGEYTISSILNYTKPFPVWLFQLPTNSGQVQAAVSVFSLLLVEVILLLIGALNWRRGTEKRG